MALDRDSRPDEDRVRRMSQLLRHRGPDGSGTWRSPTGRACFTHRRLSIIDIATGQQPMIGRDGMVGLVLNGEIYNYRELRNQLARRGAEFQTQSDTEAILRGYELDGAACVPALRGMFAFAIWDERAETLLLARDRAGEKPLFYCIEEGVLYFSSTLDALIRSKGPRPPINFQALDSFLDLGYIPAPLSIFEGVHKLAAGSILTADHRSTVVERYWRLDPESHEPPVTFQAAADRLDELLQTSVALQLQSEVPLGVFLSGGVDSSLITALAIRAAGGTLSTFTIGFGNPGEDEVTWASAVARHLGTAHRVFDARPELLSLLPRIVRHYGEPFGDATVLPTWLLAEQSRRFVTVALGGDGGDEGFAGYPWYRTALRLARLRRAVPTPVARLGRRAAARGSELFGPVSGPLGRLERALSVVGSDTEGAMFAALRTSLGPADAGRLYGPPLRQVREEGRWSIRFLRRLHAECDGSPLQRMRYVDIGSYLADGLLPKVDVATMAHSLEARAPLLDYRILEFAFSLPDRWLLDRRVGKRLLRAVLGRYLPPALVDRPKQGFTVPLAKWLSGSSWKAVEALARSERLVGSGWFQASGIAALCREYSAGARDHGQRLYNLLVLDEWLKAA